MLVDASRQVSGNDRVRVALRTVVGVHDIHLTSRLRGSCLVGNASDSIPMASSGEASSGDTIPISGSGDCLQPRSTTSRVKTVQDNTYEPQLVRSISLQDILENFPEDRAAPSATRS